MQGTLVSEIKRLTGFDRGTLDKYIIEWNKDRKAIHNHMMMVYDNAKKEIVPNIIHGGLTLIDNKIKQLLHDKEALTIADIERLTNIITNFDKLKRLDIGDPTEIKEIKRTIPATLKDLQKAINSDPFIDTIVLKDEEFHNVEIKEHGKEETKDNEQDTEKDSRLDSKEE